MSKKLYVTTAIPYVNAKPHIGNAIDYLLADIWARYHRQHGQEVRFQVGTDEHGNKIAMNAAEAGLDPQAYADQQYGNFEALIRQMNVGYTDFIRTTNPNHKAAVQYIWQQLKPYIYKDAYEGWYCVGHEAFFTEKEVTETEGVCPDHQTPYERISEENYYLKTSQFSDQIKEALEAGRMQIVPEWRKREFLELIKDGLQDVSISRPRKSLSWGVPVPDDPEHVMYVWLDALANYITVLGYPSNEAWREYWPADVEVVGKDILRFHAGIWPAMLLGLGLPLPKKLLVHGFVNVGGAKMSKTVGNVVDPSEIISQYGVDAFRYYFSRHVPTFDDGDFTWERFEEAYNTELSNELGNALQRISSMIARYQAGVVGRDTQSDHDDNHYHEAMRELNFSRAMDIAWDSVRSLNRYLERVKPWEVAKRRETDQDAEAHLGEILAHSADSLQSIASMLTPFLPDTAAAIQAVFAGEVITPTTGVLFPKQYRYTKDPNQRSES